MKKLKVVVSSIYSPPELVGIAKYTGEMIVYLAERNVEVTLVTSAPYYPQWKVWKGFSAWKYQTERTTNVKTIRCPVWVPKKVSGLKKMIHLVAFGIASLPVTLWLMARHKPDVVFVLYPYLFTAPAAVIARRVFFRKTKVWIHVQDFELDAAFDMGLIKNNTLKRIGFGLERFLLTRSDMTSSISNNMVKRLRGKGVPEANVNLFPNWIDTKDFKNIRREENQLVKELQLPPNSFIALYSGSIGEKQGLELIVDIAKTVKCKEILFLVFGEGPNREILIERADGLANIKFFNLVPADRLNELLCIADVHLLPQVSDAEDLVLPSKLLGMLASGRPVVATANPGTQLFEILTDVGSVVAPGNIEEFSEALASLVSNPQLRDSMGVAGKEIVENLWDKEIVMRDFCENIRHLTA